MTKHAFFWLIWLTNVNSFRNINSSYFHNSYKHSSKNTCGYYLPSSSKTIQATNAKLWSFSVLFKGKLSCELNLIFVKSFLYLLGLSLIFFIRFLIPFHSSLYFFNTSLVLSVEAKKNYLFPFFFQWIHLLY